MDVKPKSNRLKRLEIKQKRARQAERQLEEKVRAEASASRHAAAQAVRDWKAVRHDPERLIEKIAAGETIRVPVTSDLHVIAELFEKVRPDALRKLPCRLDVAVLRRLVLQCWKQTNLLRGRAGAQYGAGLLALCAHTRRWVRALEDWKPRTHNAYWQFHALVRHLTARYDVPVFLNSAWLEGLTPAGVVHQDWFLHVAHGQNIRTANGLPVPLTKRQAHLYLQAPDDFDSVSALRWAQVADLGGDDRLVRSILRTRAGIDFARDEFWLTVFRWLVAHPMLDAVHHGPIIDYLNHQRFVGTVANPLAGRPGQPPRVPAQPNLTMKGRSPETLLAAVTDWHRLLSGARNARPVAWPPSGIAPFRHEEGMDETRKVYQITELLSSRELIEEGRAMSHCVATYASSCASGRTAIWSLTVTDADGQRMRPLTLEVNVEVRAVVQARQRYNRLPTEKELNILRRWTGAGGPALSKWLVR